MGERLDVLASQPHYVDHLRPIWDALPVEARGTWWGLTGEPLPRRLRDAGTNPLAVAGLVDAQKLPGRPLILVEHGAGQAYPGDPQSARHGSYSGGDGLERAIGFITPNEACAQRWRNRYNRPAFAVGCPKLDTYSGRTAVRPEVPVVAISFHWDCPLIGETRSAFGHYAQRLPRIVEEIHSDGFTVIGHAHPKIAQKLRRVWHDLGVEYVERFDQVMEMAWCYVADNTSTLYEFAATNRPVVVLNAPWYRRNVHHGLRFWDHLPGIDVASPDLVGHAVRIAIDDRPDLQERRRAATAAAYAAVDGRAAERAAVAILAMLDR